MLQSLNNFGRLIFSRTFYDHGSTSIIDGINCISIELRNVIILLDVNKRNEEVFHYIFLLNLRSIIFSGSMIASFYILLIIIHRAVDSS